LSRELLSLRTYEPAGPAAGLEDTAPDFGEGDFDAGVSLFELLVSDFDAGVSAFAADDDSDDDDPDDEPDDVDFSARLSLR
jgi:hypothetical protein